MHGKRIARLIEQVTFSVKGRVTEQQKTCLLLGKVLGILVCTRSSCYRPGVWAGVPVKSNTARSTAHAGFCLQWTLRFWFLCWGLPMGGSGFSVPLCAQMSYLVTGRHQSGIEAGVEGVRV